MLPKWSSFVVLFTRVLNFRYTLTASSVDSNDDLDYCALLCNRFTVNREELWCDSIVLFKSTDFCVEHPLRIRFQGEAGVDAGGLSREYATRLRNALFSAEAAFLKGKVTGDFLCTMVMLC